MNILYSVFPYIYIYIYIYIYVCVCVFVCVCLCVRGCLDSIFSCLHILLKMADDDLE